MEQTREEWHMGMNVGDVVVLMTEGNIGALDAVVRLLRPGYEVGLHLLACLDDMNLRGSMLYVAFADHCQRDLIMFAKCIRNRDPAMVETVNREVRQGSGGHWLAVESGARVHGRPRLPDDFTFG